jgi:FlaA1/EpsC-like NDP-sugar epimerase
MLLDMGEPVRIVDLARDMITLSGFRPDVDIQIEFQGIRPGEKLFEELRTSGEDMLPTHHRKIFIWQSQTCTPEEAEAALGRLRGVCDGAGADEVLRTLRSVVPEFEPTPATRAAAVAADNDAPDPPGTRNVEPGTRNAEPGTPDSRDQGHGTRDQAPG